MAEDVRVTDDPCNSCCQVWKEKYTKLKERCSKYESGRNALREAISILEQKISDLQAENLGLRKACDERARAESEKDDKGKESAMRVFLENEVSALKSEILLLQEKGKLGSKDGDQEVASFQVRISEAETEIIELKELLQKERKRVAEEKEIVEMQRKKAEKALEKVKAEKKKASEEKRLADIEIKKGKEFKLQYETLKCDAEEAKSKLALEIAKYEEEMKKLKAERGISKKEGERADKEMAIAEDLLTVAEANWKKAMDERNRADRLSQQLDENKKRLDQLGKEFLEHVSNRKLVEIGEVPSGMTSRETNALESCKKHEKLEKKLLKVKKQVKSEMKKAKEQTRVAEAYKTKSMEEKNRADKLSCELEGNKQWMEKIQNEIQELVSSVEVFESFDPACSGNLRKAASEIKLLRKKLKFERMRVKHANEVSKIEMKRNQILQQEFHRLKQEFFQFSRHFDVLDKCSLVQSEDTNDLEKIGRLNSEQQHFHVQPSLMIPHTENESWKPSCTRSIASGSGPMKQSRKPTVLRPPVSGEICTSPITGTDSSLELLVRGSNRKMLQTSAINSSSAYFSDRPLVGSQEKATFSVAAPALLAEKQYLGPTISSLSEDARKGYDVKLGVGAENSVGSPMKSGVTERSGKRHRKRKRFPDEVESIANLYSAGQRWHQQVLQKLSVLHGMLNGESLCLEEKLLVPKVHENVCSKSLRPHKMKKTSNSGLEMLNTSQLKTKPDTCTEISEICKNALTTECNTDTLKFRDTMEDVLGTRWQLPMNLEVLGQDYMKLVDLDNDEDGQRFRKAIEEPLSPLSPALCNVQFPCTETAEIDMHAFRSSAHFPRVQDNATPCGFDVINLEIDSNKRALESVGSYQNSSFEMCKPDNDSKKNLDNVGSCNSNIITGISGQFQNSSKVLVAPGAKNSTCECRVSAFARFPQYCVVSSNNIECSSIYRIFHACSGFMSQFSGSCSIERLIQNILLSFQKADGLSAGEQVSVFLSLLLHYVPETANALGDFISFSDANSIQFMDSFSQQWHAALTDAATKKMFLESCHVGGLLALIRDFLLNRIILVYGDVSRRMMHGCDSGEFNDKCRFWSTAAASTDLLFTGGLLLASICVSVDQIGFICEISYNLFSTSKISISFLLKLLHVFAYICGPKYFTFKDYGLEMYVLKSLVVFLEKLNSSSTDKVSCLHSVSEKLVKISACARCPFLEDVESVDFVVLFLLEKLESYALSGAEKQDPCQALLSSKSVAVFHGMKKGNSTDIPCHREAGQLNFVDNQHLCCFIDILSLVELVASFMTWDWTFGNIISRLFKILDSYVPEYILPAVIALLGQLGRIGVDAKGYEDSQVGSLRNWLVGFLGRKSHGLSVQFASVTALIGLVARSLEEVIETSVDSPPTDSQSVAANCVCKWFSSLTEKEQSCFGSLHSSN